MFDLKITGGTIVDGTGRAPFAGDVAIEDGRIVAVGDCAGPARRTIDARGAHVLPGFVDIHTHYDGQVSWDEELTPSSLHGVTTCVMGSCGVGFAPVRPGREDDAHRADGRRRGHPGLGARRGHPVGLGVVRRLHGRGRARCRTRSTSSLQVPHDPLRMYVMGERAVAGEVATDDDIAAMRALLRAALEAGAAGFSTGRSDNHRTARGAATPASEADARELAGIAAAFRGLGHGVLQAVSDFDMMTGPERFDPEFDLLEQMAVASGGRPLSISTMQRDHAPESVAADPRARRARGRARPRRALSGRRARHRRAARARGDVPPVHGLPVVQGDRAPAARRARRADARPRAARAHPRRRRATRSPATARRSRRSPTSSSRTSTCVAMRLFRMARAPATTSRRMDTLPRRRGRCARACRCSRGSTTRCSRTTARRCSTSRSTTTRA